MSPAEFLSVLFDGLEGFIEVRPMLDTATGEERPRPREDARRWYDSPFALAKELPVMSQWGKANRQALFFGVLPRPKGRGKSADCLPGRVVWADTDWKAHAGGQDEARARVGRFPIQPTIVVRSAHGLHLYWVLDSVMEPRELSRLSKAVGRCIGGDEVSDAGRLLRLPGSWNMKDPSAPIQATVETIRRERVSAAVLAAACAKILPDEGPRSDRGEPFRGSLEVALQDGSRVSVGRLLADRAERGMRTEGKLKIGCPFEDGSSPGSAFLKELDGGGVFIQCTSSRHEHWTRAGLRQWWLDDPKRAPPPKRRRLPPKEEPEPARMPAGAEPEVWEGLDMTRQQSVRPSPLNVWRVLESDTRWAGRIHLNEMDGRIYLDTEPLTDSGVTLLRRWLDQHYTLRVTKGDAADVLIEWAAEKSRHPLRRMLEGLEWDGVERHSSFLEDYFGAAKSALNSEIGKRWLISAVARVFQPGCKVDTVLILVGPQGALKSTAFRELAMRDRWFSDTAMSFQRGNDALEKIRGIWIYELAELASVRRSDVEAVKAFVSSRNDRYREAYGRFLTESPRQCVIVGSTNEAEFLVDSTGSRRFWPIAVGAIDLEGIRRDREQLWAEAVTRYRGDEHWWLEGSYHAGDDENAEPIMVRYVDALADASMVFQSGDPWARKVAAWVSLQRGPFAVDQVLRDALGKDIDRLTRMDSMRVVGILSALGCTGIRVSKDGRRVRKWMRPKPAGGGR